MEDRIWWTPPPGVWFGAANIGDSDIVLFREAFDPTRWKIARVDLNAPLGVRADDEVDEMLQFSVGHPRDDHPVNLALAKGYAEAWLRMHGAPLLKGGV